MNYYSHFFKEHYIREKDIEWVLHLRNLDNVNIVIEAISQIWLLGFKEFQISAFLRLIKN